MSIHQSKTVRVVAFGLAVTVGSEAAHAQPFDDDYVARMFEGVGAEAWAPHGSHSEHEDAPRSARAMIGYGVNSLTPWLSSPPNFGLIDSDE